MPQPPQLPGSELVSTQVPLQSSVGGGQGLLAQPPFTQASPAGQTLPQKPQLFGSDCVSVQVPLQNDWPGGQMPPSAKHGPLLRHWQMPPKQVIPNWQTSPQKPQLFGSDCVLVQNPLQSV